MYIIYIYIRTCNVVYPTIEVTIGLPILSQIQYVVLLVGPYWNSSWISGSFRHLCIFWEPASTGQELSGNQIIVNILIDPTGQQYYPTGCYWLIWLIVPLMVIQTGQVYRTGDFWLIYIYLLYNTGCYWFTDCSL